MSSRPSLMSGPMVRAILSDDKLETRREVTVGRSLVDGISPIKKMWAALQFDKAWIDPGPSPAGNPGPCLKVPYPNLDAVPRVYCRTQPGDVLWVRETWQYNDPEDVPEDIWFRADGSLRCGQSLDCRGGRVAPTRWRPSIHMPKDACRLELEVINVRPERLNIITVTDCVLEGMLTLKPTDLLEMGASKKRVLDMFRWVRPDITMEDVQKLWADASAKDRFQLAWSALHGPGSFDDRWVWVISFRRKQG